MPDLMRMTLSRVILISFFKGIALSSHPCRECLFVLRFLNFSLHLHPNQPDAG